MLSDVVKRYCTPFRRIYKIFNIIEGYSCEYALPIRKSDDFCNIKKVLRNF